MPHYNRKCGQQPELTDLTLSRKTGAVHHVDKNSIRGTYNHALYLDGRREMMQWYADYIDSLAGLSPEAKE